MTIRTLLAAALIFITAPAFSESTKEAEIRSFVSGSFREIRSAHTGQPTIVHFWGLSCGPCLIEMPEWGKLLAERPQMKLVLIHADPQPRNMKLLDGAVRRTGLANAENWAFGDDSPERLRFEVDPKWRGETPMTLLIEPDGKTARIIGTVEMANIRTWLDAHTNQGSGGTPPNITASKGEPTANGVQNNVAGL